MDEGREGSRKTDSKQAAKGALRRVKTGRALYVFFDILYEFIVSPYFYHDAFMHHTMHVLDASANDCKGSCLSHRSSQWPDSLRLLDCLQSVFNATQGCCAIVESTIALHRSSVMFYTGSQFPFASSTKSAC